MAFPLAAGVRGDALFAGPNSEYRLWLSRVWQMDAAAAFDVPFALWIGMNPSTAGPRLDDRTVRREIEFTRKLGLQSYVKVNVCDYRATQPERLLTSGVLPRSSDNLSTIISLAERAARVVLAFGLLPKQLRFMADEAVLALTSRGIGLYCVGFTKDGFPRHPLYVPASSEIVPFKRGE
ncbi:DUF1643 domain-containing protein [Xanthobacter sp. DSM 14520]|uniref:DUF1643 domain-containing protein n=1 Tax=Xanthobacter autotrophicus (strain ATCC BAA-1158 / Py2) TaxID=78245 RepID=UPI0037290801